MQLSAVSVTVLAVLLSAVHCQAGAQAVSCEELQASIEAKIRGNGVQNFAVRVVEAASSPEGQAVGTCERGTKKLVYVKLHTASPAASLPKAAAAASATTPAKGKTKLPPVITECADGRVITTGSCKSP
jgi:hypothetical protein